MSNNEEQNWLDNNPFFSSKDGYEGFVAAMSTAAEKGNLPICLKHEDPESLSMLDIKQFSQRFKRDTGLNIEFQLFTCNHCDRLHCCLIIDEIEDNEDE